MTGICRSCGASILWARTRLGLSMPVDPDPVPGGNLDLITDRETGGTIVVYVDADDTVRHVSHFATCPDATRHRRRKSR